MSLVKPWVNQQACNDEHEQWDNIIGPCDNGFREHCLRQKLAGGAKINDNICDNPESKTDGNNKSGTSVMAFVFFLQQNAHTDHHDEGIEKPADGPGKWYEVCVFSCCLDESVGRQGMKCVHTACEKESQTDDGSGDVALNREMHKSEDDREIAVQNALHSRSVWENAPESL